MNVQPKLSAHASWFQVCTTGKEGFVKISCTGHHQVSCGENWDVRLQDVRMIVALNGEIELPKPQTLNSTA